MGIRKILQWGGAGVGALIVIGSYVLDGLSLTILNLPNWAWSVIGVVVFAVFIAYIILGYHNEHKRKEEILSSQIKNLELQSPSTGIQQKQLNLIDEFQMAKAIWGLWYSGTTTRTDRVLDNTKSGGRVLLMNPDEQNEALRQVVKETTTQLNEVITDIIYTAKHAVSNRFITRFYSIHLAQSFTIYDPTPNKRNGELIPDSNNAWVTVKYLDPVIGAGARKLERFYKNKDDARFNGYLSLYQDTWQQAKVVELKKGKVSSSNQQWEVKNICQTLPSLPK